MERFSIILLKSMLLFEENICRLRIIVVKNDLFIIRLRIAIINNCLFRVSIRSIFSDIYIKCLPNEQTVYNIQNNLQYTSTYILFSVFLHYA